VAAGRGAGMWRSLQIAWRIIWGLIEFGIVISVLNTIKNKDTALIISTLGLIYATIRSLGLNTGLMNLRMAATYDFQLNEIKRLVHRLAKTQASVTDDQWFQELSNEKIEQPDAEALMSKAYVDVSIAGVFIFLIYLACLYQFFSRLS
jgi:hypothetical protein